MVFDGAIEGRYVKLISATADDAEFTLNLRQDPELNQYLPRINNTIEQQVQWIAHQREKMDDYFFVIWDMNGNRIGTIGIYDIEGNHAEAGRLIVRGNALQSIEAQMLSFEFGFVHLNLDIIYSYIYADNVRALRFNQQFGGEIEPPLLHVGKLECKTTNRKEIFFICQEKFKKLLYRDTKENRNVT